MKAYGQHTKVHPCAWFLPLVHECTGYGSGAFEAAQEVRLGVDAGVEQLAQQDGSAESHGVECDGKWRFLCDYNFDDMRHERAHGRMMREYRPRAVCDANVMMYQAALERERERAELAALRLRPWWRRLGRRKRQPSNFDVPQTVFASNAAA